MPLLALLVGPDSGPLLAPLLAPPLGPVLAPLHVQLRAGAPVLLARLGEGAAICTAATAGAAAGATAAATAVAAATAAAAAEAAVACGHAMPISKVVVRHVRDPSRAPIALCRADSCNTSTTAVNMLHVYAQAQPLQGLWCGHAGELLLRCS